VHPQEENRVPVAGPTSPCFSWCSWLWIWDGYCPRPGTDSDWWDWFPEASWKKFYVSDCLLQPRLRQTQLQPIHPTQSLDLPTPIPLRDRSPLLGVRFEIKKKKTEILVHYYYSKWELSEIISNIRKWGFYLRIGNLSFSMIFFLVRSAAKTRAKQLLPWNSELSEVRTVGKGRSQAKGGQTGVRK